MAKQTVKYGLNSLVIIISFIMIIAVINFISTRHFKRVDITKEKEYTITDATKKILSELKDYVRVKVYLSEKLPPNLINVKRDIVDMLEEYNIYSKGKLKIEFIDPSGDTSEEKEQELAMKGIQKIPVTILEKEKLESTAIYISMIIEYNDKSETIPVIQTQTMEYDMTSSIIKVTTDPKKVGIFFKKAKEEESAKFKEDYKVLMELIRKNYEFVEVSDKSIEQSLNDIDTLLLIGPDDLSERELYLVDQFVMRGGKLIAFVDAVKFQPQTMMPTKQSLNIAKMLEHYGIKINEDLLIDYDQRARTMASFNMGNMIVQMPYPFYIKVLPEGYNSEQPVAARLNDVVMPWTSSIQFKDDLPKDIEKFELLKTSKNAGHQTDNFDINPNKKFAPKTKDELQQFLLAGIISGKFTSYYKDKEKPAPVKADENSPAPTEDNTPKIDAGAEVSQILVVGTSRFAEDRRCFAQTYGGVQMADNGKFILNSIDWMTMGKALISIRSRNVGERPLRELSDSQVSVYRFLGTFGIAILVVIAGIFRMFIKKARRRKLAAIYTSGS